MIESMELFNANQRGSSATSALPLEQRVKSLEETATTLEKALAQLESVAQTNPAGGSLPQGQQMGDGQLVHKLRTLLDLLQQDREECEAIRAQRDDLTQENERLRTQVKKHEYRIMHLLRTIDEIEGKQEKKDAK